MGFRVTDGFEAFASRFKLVLPPLASLTVSVSAGYPCRSLRQTVMFASNQASENTVIFSVWLQGYWRQKRSRRSRPYQMI